MTLSRIAAGLVLSAALAQAHGADGVDGPAGVIDNDVAPVPEPGAWLLMPMGFAMLSIVKIISSQRSILPEGPS
jgi:hypothetical protein